MLKLNLFYLKLKINKFKHIIPTKPFSLLCNIINKDLSADINKNTTELIVKLMIVAAIYEFMYMHKIPTKVIISEYLKVSEFFIENSKKNFLNAILDKASRLSRVKNNE